jgi:hypothetical protein
VRLDLSAAATVTFTIRVFETTNETDIRGYFRLTKHHEVRFRFEGVAAVSIPERDDTLLSLTLANELDSEGRSLVLLESNRHRERRLWGILPRPLGRGA